MTLRPPAPARPTIDDPGRAGEPLRYAIGSCALGTLLVASSAAGIVAIQLGDDPDALIAELRARFPGAVLTEHAGDAALAAVAALVDAPARAAGLALDIRGTGFQRRVWRELRTIPPGTTLSYAALAGAIGAPGAARAVAGACAANALAIAIPCHRVVRGDGSLSGYRWGAERKRALLAREALA